MDQDRAPAADRARWSRLLAHIRAQRRAAYSRGRHQGQQEATVYWQQERDQRAWLEGRGKEPNC